MNMCNSMTTTMFTIIFLELLRFKRFLEQLIFKILVYRCYGNIWYAGEINSTFNLWLKCGLNFRFVELKEGYLMSD